MAFRDAGELPQYKPKKEPQKKPQPKDADEVGWRGVLLGLAAAFGAGLILAGPAIRVFVEFSGPGRAEGAPGLSEALLTTSLALLVFFYGGYAAGRAVGRSGVRHGVLVPALTLGLAAALALFVGAVGLCGSAVGGLAGGDPTGVLRGAEPLISAVPLILTAVLSAFPAGAFGGARGARDGCKER